MKGSIATFIVLFVLGILYLLNSPQSFALSGGIGFIWAVPALLVVMLGVWFRFFFAKQL